MAKVGRKAREEYLAQDPTPGKILVLSILANAPIAAGFVLAPLFTGGDPTASRASVPFVLYITPPLALGAGYIYWRAGPDAKRHRAARIGLVLALASMLMWGFLAFLTFVAKRQ